MPVDDLQFYYSSGGAWQSRPAGDTLQDALRFALARFADDPHLGSSWLHAPDNDGRGDGSALLFPVSPGHVLVVGLSPVAEQARELLDAGYASWRLHPLPLARTSVDTLKSRLDTRMYNVIVRSGFTTVEEVAAVPAASWHDLRNAGAKSVQALRRVLAEDRAEQAGRTQEFDERRQYLEQHLEAHTRLRYPEFVDQLAASRIPLAALDKICAALDAEPLPPADATVQLLLDTAGELGLLDLYNRTHADGEADQSNELADGTPWTADRAEEVLRLALPSGSVLLRALVDEGGTATAERLKQLTGAESLGPMTQTLHAAMRKVFGARTPEQRRRRLIRARRDTDHPRDTAVHDYALARDLLPIFDEALRRLGR